MLNHVVRECRERIQRKCLDVVLVDGHDWRDRHAPKGGESLVQNLASGGELFDDFGVGDVDVDDTASTVLDFDTVCHCVLQFDARKGGGRSFTV